MFAWPMLVTPSNCATCLAKMEGREWTAGDVREPVEHAELRSHIADCVVVQVVGQSNTQHGTFIPYLAFWWYDAPIISAGCSHAQFPNSLPWLKMTSVFSQAASRTFE